MPDRGQEIAAVGVFFLIASWAIFLLRLCSRLRLFKQFKVDDWSLVIVQTSFTVYLGCQLGGAVHGSGRRESALTQAERAQALKWWYLTFLSYILTTCALKVSIGIFLIRIAVNRRHLVVLHVLTWGTLAFGIPFGIMMAVQCRPIQTFWNASPRAPGKCWDYTLMETLTHVASALNCFADWVFGIIPFLIVRSLNIARPTKALVAWLLCFAAIGSIATIVRTFFIPQMLSDHDFLYDTVDLCIWSTVEVGVGVLAWSAATCRPIHRYFLARLQVWSWMGGDQFGGPRCDAKEPFAHFPVRDLKLRPDEYHHESRCSSNGGSSAIRASKRKGSIFVTAQEVRRSLSLAEEGGITRTLELSQITSRRGALFPPLPEVAHMPNHLTSVENTSVSSLDVPKSRLASLPFLDTPVFNPSSTPVRRYAIVPTRSMRNAPVSYWPRNVFKSSRKSPTTLKNQGPPPPLHLMSGSIDSGHCSIAHIAPHSAPSNISTTDDNNNSSSSSSNNNNNARRSSESLVSPRQSVAASFSNNASLRWSTSSEASCYPHNHFRDTFEPLGLSAPPRAAFLQRCSHLKPPVFQPIKWRRSRDSQQRQQHRTSSTDLLSVCLPQPSSKMHSMREFGQWSPASPTNVRFTGGGSGGSRVSTIVDRERGEGRNE